MSITEQEQQLLTKVGMQALVPQGERRFNDPAEYIDFIRPLADNYLPFDVRSLKELQRVVAEDDSELERERALWEITDRIGVDAMPMVLRMLGPDSSRDLRESSLWLALQTLGQRVVPLLEQHFHDDDPEVADWSRVLHGDMVGSRTPRAYSDADVNEGHHFDQTVPLLISGQVIVSVPDVGPTRARLSPLWFDSILGKVTACTNADTIHTNLVIEKALRGLHADGSTHYEVFPFRGTSVEYNGRFMEHTYLSETMRPFYTEGLVEQGPWSMTQVSLARVAVTAFADTDTWTIHGNGPRAERLRNHDWPFVESVRGRFSGWAASNMDAIQEAGTVKAGHVQLSSPTDPIAGPKTNTKVFGTFRGKPRDFTGNGHLTLNHIQAHGDAAGRMDYHADGSMAADPWHHFS